MNTEALEATANWLEAHPKNHRQFGGWVHNTGDKSLSEFRDGGEFSVCAGGAVAILFAPEGSFVKERVSFDTDLLHIPGQDPVSVRTWSEDFLGISHGMGEELFYHSYSAEVVARLRWLATHPQAEPADLREAFLSSRF